MNLIRIAFPAKPSKPEITAFPHQVHSVMHGPSISTPRSSSWSLKAVLQEAGEWMEQKQGFMIVRADGQRSMAQEIKSCFGKNQTIRIDEHCVVQSIKRAPQQPVIDTIDVYIASVYDERLGCAVDVPITEVHIPDASKNTAEDHTLGRKLTAAKRAMDEQLQHIHPAFLDSPYSPPILCPSNPRLGHLLSTQEECLSRLYRREYTSDDRFDWINFYNKTLTEINPNKVGLQGEEGCGVEEFFSVLTKVNHRQLPAQSIGGHANLHPNTDYFSDYVRAYKRHMPASEAVATVASAGPSASRAAGPSANPPPFSNPAAEQAMNQRSTARTAYKEPAVQMQCAVQAINGFFQGGVASAAEIAPRLANQYLAQSQALGLNPTQSKGLAHPRVLAAMQKSESVTVDKSIFGAGNDLLLEQTHDEQWRQLINLSPQGQGKNWVDHANQLNAVEQIELTPDMWVSAQRGLQMHDLASCINEMRARGCESWAGVDLPARVALSEVATASDANRLGAAIEQAHQNMQQTRGPGADFPIVVRTGASNAAGHYFTLVPDLNGNWLSLNADGTQVAGEQPCKVWATRGELSTALRLAGVSQVIHGELSRS